MKRENPLLSMEEVKQKYFNFEKDEDWEERLHESIWNAHWRNARNSTIRQGLENQLANHVRLRDGKPSSCGVIRKPDLSVKRAEIISFISGRLEQEFMTA